jgi:cation:H+ antiporter
MFHFPVMLLILYSFRVFIAMQGKKGYFERWQGGWLLGIYILYVVLQYALNVNIPH